MWLLILLISSFLSTIFPLPPGISPADPTFITYAFFKPFYIIFIMAGFDVMFAVITYYGVDKVKALAHRIEFINVAFKQYLLVLFTVSEKTFEFGYRLLNGEFDTEKYINKYGQWGMLISAATPLPYTLTIYIFAGSMEIKKFILYNVIGRTIKYSAIYFGIKLGISIFN